MKKKKKKKQAQGNAVGISGGRTECGENDIRRHLFNPCQAPAHVHGIVAGETPNVRDLSFRDPDCFQSGQWLEHGVDVQNLLSPLRDHLWVSSMRARNPRLEFLRKFIPTKNK